MIVKENNLSNGKLEATVDEENTRITYILIFEKK